MWLVGIHMRLTRGPLFPGRPGFPGGPGSPWKEITQSVLLCTLIHDTNTLMQSSSIAFRQTIRSLLRLFVRLHSEPVPPHTGCTVSAESNVAPFPSEAIPSQGDESSALSVKTLRACAAGNRRNSRNNRSFPAPLNAPVCLYQAPARSFSFNQKGGKGEVRKNRAPAAVLNNNTNL